MVEATAKLVRLQRKTEAEKAKRAKKAQADGKKVRQRKAKR
ncbi:hypothetical protein [Streptantibioticus parmotrematis]|nr:hypothetical protein [Streptantibioticus parmotrematis]